MIGNAKVVDVQYHAMSPGLAKAIAENVPVPTRADLKDGVRRTMAMTEYRMLNEEEQIAEAERLGVDIMWYSNAPGLFDRKSFPASSPHQLTASRTVNDYMASVCQRFPERFKAFANIPLGRGSEVAIEEMHRALKLGLHGIYLFSNYDGKHLDAPEFRAFFEEANKLRAVIYIHPFYPDPNYPLNKEQVIEDRHMHVQVALPCDTAVNIGRMAYAGILEEFSDLRFILSHAGGIIPFLWWRMDYPYREEYPGCRDHISAPPTTYLKNCYYDTALTDMESLMLTYRRVGNHLMLGTDRPYRKDALQGTLASIEAMDITSEERAKILSGNALAILNRTKS